MFGKKNQSKAHNSKSKIGEVFVLCATNRPDLKHVPIKLHEDIPNGY